MGVEAVGDDCFGIDKDFVPYKAHYFLLNGAQVGVLPYLPVFAKTTLGCSASTVGMLATFMQFTSTFSKPLFGLLADCLNHMKVLIAALVCFEVLVNVSMLALPPVPHGPTTEPIGDASHILRYAPSRLYDASIGLLSQMKVAPIDKRSSNQTRSTKNHYMLEQYLPNETVYFKSHRQRPRSIDNVAKSAKCEVRCDTLIVSATCDRPADYCLQKTNNNALSCVLLKRNSTLCPEFKTSSKFTLLSRNVSKSKDSFDIRPHQKLAYNETSHGKEFFCSADINNCSLDCPEVGWCNKTVKSDDNYIFSTYQFWLFCLFAVASSVCQGALYTLSDTLCYEKIRGTTTNYGRQRVWGAIGWGAVAPLAGFLNDLVTDNTVHEDYSSGWYIMTLLSVFLLLNLLCMDFPPTSHPITVWEDAKNSLLSSAFFLMEINVFFMGILNAYAGNYILWYMESLGSSKFLMGLALGVECLLGEAPVMHFSGWLIDKMGHWNVVTLSFAAYGARFVAFSFISNPWLMLPVELLNGITFGLFYPAMTSFAERVAPFGTEATVQGLLGGTFHGLGSGVGCLIAGFSFDNFGGRSSFLFVGIFSVILATVHGLFCFLVKSPISRQGYVRIDNDAKGDENYQNSILE